MGSPSKVHGLLILWESLGWYRVRSGSSRQGPKINNQGNWLRMQCYLQAILAHGGVTDYTQASWPAFFFSWLTSHNFGTSFWKYFGGVLEWVEPYFTELFTYFLLISLRGKEETESNFATFPSMALIIFIHLFRGILDLFLKAPRGDPTTLFWKFIYYCVFVCVCVSKCVCDVSMHECAMHVDVRG